MEAIERHVESRLKMIQDLSPDRRIHKIQKFSKQNRLRQEKRVAEKELFQK